MSIHMEDYEKLGCFYLGRGYDPESKSASGDLLLYDSKDLVTHGVVLGMTGSGKTGLCLALLEEAAMDHVPAIVIDPKGDIANLLLAFPDADPASFRPWINEDDAAKKGITPDEHAANTAAMWAKGLGEWGQSGERIRQFRERCDITIFTPGSRAGIPVSILGSLKAPPYEITDDAELLGERIQSTVSSLLSLVGVDADPIQSHEAVFTASVLSHAWSAGHDLTLESLVGHILKPAFGKVGVIDVDSFLPPKQRQTLALRFNNLIASPGFATWLEGPPLDIASMLHTPAGKPRISIFSIAHLGDAERMFFTSLLLNELLGWMRSQNGTTSLRALFYMDEIFGFLPPTANPPSKRPLMTLLKQGRAFGLGCLLATQNPVDLDYKALSNIGTWFLGRLQTERDKLRVLDGLQGAASSQHAAFDRAALDTLLSGLGNRIFLMNNVHRGMPLLFHVRWVMSYLAGPLTRAQIKSLMDPKRAECSNPANDTRPPSQTSPMSMAAATPPAAGTGRPAVGNGVTERFARPSTDQAVFHPFLLREAVVHHSLAKAGIDTSRRVRIANPIGRDGIDWDRPLDPDQIPEATSEAPASDARFADLPGYAMNEANYRQAAKEFAEWLYRNERLELFSCPALKAWSIPDETESAFRARLAHQAREARDAAVAKLRADAEKKLAALEVKLQTAEARLAKEKTEAGTATMRAGATLIGGILGGLLGGRSKLGSITRGSTAIGSAGNAVKQRQDVALATSRVASVHAEIQALEAQVENEAAAITSAHDPAGLELARETLKPARNDIRVEDASLLWLPHDADGRPAW